MVDAIYDSQAVKKMIIREFPNQMVAVQDSWGAWWAYCPHCDHIWVELDPKCVPERCPKCNKSIETTVPA
jgi:hypothetical protein